MDANSAGIPFGIGDQGRTVEALNPDHQRYSNPGTLMIGKWGAGKTLVANVLLSRRLAADARGFVIDGEEDR